MFLKIQENRPLGKLLFREKLPSIRELLHDYFSRVFSRKDTWTYELSPESLENLNSILYELKDTLKEGLKWAPLPFVFFIVQNKEHTIGPNLRRVGKIYVAESLVGSVEKALRRASHSFRFEKINKGFVELILPSTSDHTLMFFYKDAFFDPEERPCFICGTYLHRTEACPALKERVGLEGLQNLLKISLRDLADELWKALKNFDKADPVLKGFFGRHYYLLPSFLQVPFYFSSEIHYWTELQKPISFPIKGGALYLALDALIRQDYDSAKKGFIEQEGDFRADLGLAILNCLKEEFPQALYHLENALISAKTPFLKSYLLFFKGYIYFYQNDIYSAEENFREALRADSGCIPAFYFLQIIRYLEGENWTKIFPFFQHPQTIYLSFLEPLFIADEKELEDTLEKTISNFREEAVRRLKEAEDKFHKMEALFLKEDKEEYSKTLGDIRNSIYGGGLLLIEEAGKKALELNLELNKFVFSKIKKIKEDLKGLKEKLRNLELFWQTYPYKDEDVVFGNKLSDACKITRNMEKRFRAKDPTKELKNLYKEITTLSKLLEELTEIRPNLEKKWKFRLRVYLFLKRFLLAEGIVTALFLSPLLLPETPLSDFFSLSNFLLFSFAVFVIVLISITINNK